MRLLKLSLFLLCAILLQRFCHRQTDGFCMRKILSDLKPCAEWEVQVAPSLEKEALLAALSQPYRYLSKGAQAYAFASEDGKYVLKFFRHDHMREEPWLFLLPAAKRAERVQKAREKLFKDFASYKVAYEQLREETGLLFLHLNKTEELGVQTTLYDKIGIRHTAQLDEMEFLLQRRAEPFFPSLERWVRSGEIAEAKAALSALVQLLKGRFLKRVYDKDPDLSSNFGFLDARPLQIDVGRFKQDAFYSNPQVYRQEILRITDNLKQWLERHAPALYLHLQEELRAL